MVSSDDFTVWLNLNTTKARAEYQEIKRDIETLGVVWNETKDLIRREHTAILRTMGTLVNIAQNMFERMGFVLDPFQEYITGLISITITTLLQMSIAASSTVIGAPLGVTIAASAGLFSVAAHGAAQQGLSEARDSITDLENTMRDLGTLINAFSGFGS